MWYEVKGYNQKHELEETLVYTVGMFEYSAKNLRFSFLFIL